MKRGPSLTADMLVDQIAPEFDACSRHAIWIAASPERVYAVARAVDLGRPGLVRALMAVRMLPALLAYVLRSARRTSASGIGDHTVRAVRFTSVAENPGEEFVLGIMGRFWTVTGGVVATTADSFQHPPPAGLAQAVWNFHVAPSGTGTVLSTETRVRCADEATRRQFLRYWRVIRPGSALTRRSMLRHIKRVAESFSRVEGEADNQEDRAAGVQEE